MWIRIYTFCYKKKTQTHKQKAKENKENRKKKKKNKEEKEKENLVVVNRTCRKSNRIQWYCLRIFCVLSIHIINQQCLLHAKNPPKNQNNHLWKTFVYICLLYVQDENQDVIEIKAFWSTYSIHPSFPTFSIKIIEFCSL